MYNRLYLYLNENNLLYNKQFGFQKEHSTNHANVYFPDQIYKMFNKNIYTLCVFIDLPKAFDTVNHKILLRKLSHHEIKNKSLNWFTCYLSKRKQFIGYNVNSKFTLLYIICGVRQGSILGSSLFLLYINDLPQAWKLLDPITFADDTNLFCSGKDIHSLLNSVNNKLSNISHWFNSNALSINADKTKFTSFHKVRQRDNIPLVLPTLKINNTLIIRVDHIDFLGVLFDGNLTWKNHINLIENKISKSLGILNRAKFLLNQKFRKTKLKKIFTYQKKAARVIFFADRFAYAKPLMLDMNALNVYQIYIYIYQNLIRLYQACTVTAPSILFTKFSKINHNYPTSSKNSSNYSVPKSTMKLMNFTISMRGPILWNKFQMQY